MKTYFIPEFKQEKFENKMTRTAKKAEKLNIDFGFSLVGESMTFYKTLAGEKIAYKEFEYTVHGESPTINGFSFLAKIEKMQEKNIVHSHNSDYDFSEFYNADLTCEHCNINRMRNFYYIIQDENKNIKMVGRNCLANYIHIANAEQIAKFYESFFIGDGEDISDSEFESFGRSSQAYFKSFDLLTLTYAIIKEFGYTSGKRANEENIESTKWNVINDFSRGERDYTEETKKAVRIVLDAVQTNLEEIAELSNYENTMQEILSLEYVKINHIGYLVSVFSMYNRMQEIKTNKENKKESNWIGEPKQKIYDINVTLVYRNEIESQYGITYLYKFIDNAGNLYTWFASREQALSTSEYYLQVGDTLTIIRATVKKHDVYNGDKQTVINRAKLS